MCFWNETKRQHCLKNGSLGPNVLKSLIPCPSIWSAEIDGQLLIYFFTACFWHDDFFHGYILILVKVGIDY